MGVPAGGRDLDPLIDAVKARSRTVLHVAEQVAVRLHGPRGRDDKAAKLVAKMGEQFAANLAMMRAALERVPEEEWATESLLAVIKTAAEGHGLKLGDAMQPIRVALTGSTVSEPVNELLAVVGRAASLERLGGGRG